MLKNKITAFYGGMIIFLSLISGILLTKTAYALTKVVPTDYPTVQQAVNAVQGTTDATVTINSNATFTETVTITQSVTIEAGTGYTPSIQGAGTICYWSNCTISFNPNSTSSQNLTLRNLILLPRSSIGPGSGDNIIEIMNAGAGTTNILIEGVILNDPANAGPDGINIRSSTVGPNNVTVRNTTITLGGGPGYGVTAIKMLELGTLNVSNVNINMSLGSSDGFDIRGSQGSGIAFTLEDSTFNISAPLGYYSAEAGMLSWLVTAVIRRNTFNLTSNSQGSAGGIITGGGNQNVTLDSNRFNGSGPNVSSAYSAAPFAGETGTLIGTNNVIFNTAGFQLNPQSGAPGGVVNATITNNTVDGSRNSAVSFSANDGSTINATITNNLFTNSGKYGFESGVGAGATLNVYNSYNDFFNNALGATDGNVAIGSNSLYVDPLYINRAGGDLHLQATSPVINMGNNSAPSLPAIDVEGNPRISGSAVDMGAYEAPVQASAQTGGGDGGGGGGCGLLSDYKKDEQPPLSGAMLLLAPFIYLLLRRIARDSFVKIS